MQLARFGKYCTLIAVLLRYSYVMYSCSSGLFFLNSRRYFKLRTTTDELEAQKFPDSI